MQIFTALADWPEPHCNNWNKVWSPVQGICIIETIKMCSETKTIRKLKNSNRTEETVLYYVLSLWLVQYPTLPLVAVPSVYEWLCVQPWYTACMYAYCVVLYCIALWGTSLTQKALYKHKSMHHLPVHCCIEQTLSWISYGIKDTICSSDLFLTRTYSSVHNM